MDKILIYSGTTEGKQLAYLLAASNIYCDVCVATEYGRQVMQESEYIRILEGRMDVAAMAELCRENRYLAVVDATHPFATEVTANIRKSVEGSGLGYYRLLRDDSKKMSVYTDAKSPNSFFECYNDSESCANGLLKTEGRILLTTGSKELGCFCKDDKLKKRLIARVLPGIESIKLCYEAGLEGNQIIAMQGPFSTEMNLAQIREYGIKHIVTKESGVVGGTDSKYEAAMLAGISCHIISRPAEETGAAVYSFDELVDELDSLCSEKIVKAGHLSITLAGIGMGNPGMMTCDVKRSIEEADYIFGAPRLIEGLNCRCKKYPYYLAKDILPLLREIEKSVISESKIVILFSGDTGFYSGCEKLYKELKAQDRYDISISPGVSALTVMSSRLGIGWQDCGIISTHGIGRDIWEKQLISAVRNNRKTFALTSGIEDVNRIGLILKEVGDLHIYLGYRLSYEDEQVKEVTAEECIDIKKEGLYVLFVINDLPNTDME